MTGAQTCASQIGKKEAEALSKKWIVKVFSKYSPNTTVAVSMKMVSGEEIKNINRDTRSVDKVTDVLSFPLLDMDQGVLKKNQFFTQGDICLGDIIMCYDRVLSQAKEYGHSKERECAYLATHSILHLLGFDHIDEGQMKQNMRRAEEEILEKVL